MANSLRTKCLLNKIFILVLLMEVTKWCACNSSNSSSLKLGCKDYERKALLKFKHSLSSFNTSVSSTWEGVDCCKWSRVECDPTTGDVLKLQLHGWDDIDGLLSTKNMESSLQHLLELKHLEHLDISCNDFSESKFPKALGSMQQLRYLNLSSTNFGEGNPDELGNLTHLQFLDLSYVRSLNFYHLNWVSSLRKLQYLDMSGTNLSRADNWVKSLIGPLPFLVELRLQGCYLPNLDKTHPNSSFLATLPIRYLDLSSNEMWNFDEMQTRGDIPLWLGKLQSLVHLDLSGSYFTSIEGGNIWGVVHNLCSLRLLSLSDNQLNSSLPQENLSTICSRYDLEVLDLSGNHDISGSIPAWLGEKCQSLKRLDLSNNQLSGQIPTSLGMLSALEYLDLSLNNLVGTIPTSFGNLSVLKELRISDNKLSQISSFLNFPPTLEKVDISRNVLMGQIPKSLGHLSKLQSLEMNSNPLLKGIVVSETHFSNLSKLTNLDLSDTFLALRLPLDWVPPFQLRELTVGSCKINGPFPQWLQTQKSLKSLNLSNALIYGAIPKWFHTMQQLRDVDLSHNHINGSLILPINFESIDFSNNSLSGPYMISDSMHINVTYPSARYIDLSNNLISGQLPEDIGRRMPSLTGLVLSNNQIYGPIPKSIWQLELDILDLQKNRLSGTIPNCIDCIIPVAYSPMSMFVFQFVSLSSNKLSGNIPCFGPKVAYLHLSNNKLSGYLPPCLMNNTELLVLDVGGNELSGKIPAWLTVENFPNLRMLRLRGNKFSDSIPHYLCSFSELRILDLAQNRFSGTVPYCISNLTAMFDHGRSYWFDLSYFTDLSKEYKEIDEVIKGYERGYTSILEYLVNIDLSCNELVGNIPDGVTNLSGLVSLNLSNNQLSGVIPQKIGALKSLESLDLSNNRLWGTIPTSMTDLYELSYLNVSYNNFSGQMPTGYQLRTFVDPSIYAGNPFLCGEFLPKKCKTINDVPKDSEKKGAQEDEYEDNKHETMWFYLVVMSGFATGFWGVVGTLLVQRRWRHALFQRVEDAYDRLYVAIVVSMASLNKMWNGSSDESNRSG